MAKINPSMVTLAREWRQLTQSELATRLGVTQGKLSKMESGLLSMSDEIAESLATILACPINFFEQTNQLYGPAIGELYHRKRHSAAKKLMQYLYAGVNVRRIHVERLLRGVEIMKNLSVSRWRHVWRLSNEATQDIFEYIEVFHNRLRHHSTLGYYSPVEFEARTAVA